MATMRQTLLAAEMLPSIDFPQPEDSAFLVSRQMRKSRPTPRSPAALSQFDYLSSQRGEADWAKAGMGQSTRRLTKGYNRRR